MPASAVCRYSRGISFILKAQIGAGGTNVIHRRHRRTERYRIANFFFITKQDKEYCYLFPMVTFALLSLPDICCVITVLFSLLSCMNSVRARKNPRIVTIAATVARKVLFTAISSPVYCPIQIFMDIQSFGRCIRAACNP